MLFKLNKDAFVLDTYNEKLRCTVNETLISHLNELAKLESAQTIAEYALYHAQDQEITCQHSLEKTNEQVTRYRQFNEQTERASNLALNLLSSVKLGKNKLDLSVKNAAKAASDW